MGTPRGSSQSGSSAGFCVAGAVKRALGCEALASDAGVQSLPCQSIACAGGSPSMPSHHTSPSSVSATLVKIVLARIDSNADGLVEYDVPGATPKYPASGLIAYSLPSAPGLIQAMSSPTVVTFQPSSANAAGGTSMAKLVFPHALGNAAATNVLPPSGSVTPMISMCSASQPSSRAIVEAIRRARHFLPSRALPP